MIIAAEKKKNNIAEYVLYMWQIEDIIRANKFDINNIEQSIINKFNVSSTIQSEIKEWYKDLIVKMQKEKIEELGHLSFLQEIIKDIFKLHLKLISSSDNKYIEQYRWALGNIEIFRAKLKNDKLNDVEVCFHALYLLLLLKLQKKNISTETMEAMSTFSNMLAYLSSKYKLVE